MYGALSRHVYGKTREITDTVRYTIDVLELKKLVLNSLNLSEEDKKLAVVNIFSDEVPDGYGSYNSEIVTVVTITKTEKSKL